MSDWKIGEEYIGHAQLNSSLFPLLVIFLNKPANKEYTSPCILPCTKMGRGLPWPGAALLGEQANPEV